VVQVVVVGVAGTADALLIGRIMTAIHYKRHRCGSSSSGWQAGCVASFARRYNGPNFAVNNYDGLLRHFYEIYSGGVLPSVEIPAVQVAQAHMEFPVGRADDVMGDRTTNAIKHFQAAIHLAGTGLRWMLHY
jgi:N-acetylmuramidase